MKIELNPKELAWSTRTGIKRQKVHEEAGRPDGKIVEWSGEDVHIGGAEGELVIAKAVAKILGKSLKEVWDGRFHENEAWQDWRNNGNDVSGLEVRTSKYRNGRLLLHRTDPDDRPFILVSSYEKPVFEIKGWCLGKDGKKEEWWGLLPNRKEEIEKCFIVPYYALLSFDQLPLDKYMRFTK